MQERRELRSHIAAEELVYEELFPLVLSEERYYGPIWTTRSATMHDAGRARCSPIAIWSSGFGTRIIHYRLSMRSLRTVTRYAIFRDSDYSDQLARRERALGTMTTFNLEDTCDVYVKESDIDRNKTNWTICSHCQCMCEESRPLGRCSYTKEPSTQDTMQ